MLSTMRKRNTSFSATDVRSHFIHYEASELVIYCISRVETYPCVHNKIFLARSLYEFICNHKASIKAYNYFAQVCKQPRKH